MEEPKPIVKPDHITYREYKVRLSKKPHQSFVLFISAFFILLLAFLGFAKLMSPDVDIAIGDEPQVESEQEGIIRGNVDDRLKKLQDEDNSLGGENTFSTELDEKVTIPEKKTEPESESLGVQEETPVVLESEKAEEKPVQEPEQPVVQPKPEPQPQVEHLQSQPPQAPVPVASSKIYKVYIGSYSSAAQAEVAKGILSESNAGVSVFVKSLNGSYTLQAGSYTSQEKAQAAASDLLKNNFPARVVAE